MGCYLSLKSSGRKSMIEYKTPSLMVATTAIHLTGDISRAEPDFCWISGEEGTDYIGSWRTGYGFIEVRFPKATTRKAGKNEKRRVKRERIGIVGFGVPGCFST